MWLLFSCDTSLRCCSFELIDTDVMLADDLSSLVVTSLSILSNIDDFVVVGNCLSSVRREFLMELDHCSLFELTP